MTTITRLGLLQKLLPTLKDFFCLISIPFNYKFNMKNQKFYGRKNPLKSI